MWTSSTENLNTKNHNIELKNDSDEEEKNFLNILNKMSLNDQVNQLTETVKQLIQNQNHNPRIDELAQQMSNLSSHQQFVQEQTLTELTQKIAELNTRVSNDQQPNISTYEDINVTIISPNEVSLEVFKTLPEFSGERFNYPTWRTMTITAMKLLENHSTSMKYFEALMIIRNKIKGAAPNLLNNYNTAFNFDAIIDRLDFNYADKRPLYILEQEMMVLQQNKLNVDEFYDKVNEKLNSIINKINMTYKERVTANAFIESVNSKALRTFITGLNNKKGELLYAANPSSLPEAYARLQTIMNDQHRINFVNRFNNNDRGRDFHQQMRNPQFKFSERNSNEHRMVQPMEVDKSTAFSKRNNQIGDPMEVDRVSTKVNVERRNNQNNSRFTPSFRRNPTNRNFPHQQINNVEDADEKYARTIVEDGGINFEDEESEAKASNEIDNVSTCRSSIFLGE